jgi:hypothetical protein
VGEFKPQGLANTIWGLGKLGVKATTHEVRCMVDALCGEVTAQLTHSRHKGEAGEVAARPAGMYSLAEPPLHGCLPSRR